MKASQLKARYRRIVRFFAGVTASFILWEILAPRIGLRKYVNATRPARSRKTAIRFRALAVSMGGLMIKVGQFLSARLDILPQEITDELADLQDEVPAEQFSAIRQQAEAGLGKPLEDAFAWVEPTPLAAASLGQAHRARLCDADAAAQGYADVVVKVQRPYIGQIVDVDLAALRRVAGWLQRYKPISRRADVRALVEEFAATTLEELDYTAEGRNAEIFSANFADNPRIHVPRVIWSHSTRHVLTLEDVSAIKLGDYDAITAAGIDRRHVAEVLVDTYMQQIFEDGFFHADPHPGNLFVTPREGVDEEGRRNWQLTFIDFGMVGRVQDNLRDGLREAIMAVGTQDASRLVQAFKSLDVLLPSADTKLIELAGAQLFDRFWGMSMGDLKALDHAEVARFAMQFRELLLEMPFQLPQNLLMLGRTVAILSGMCTGLSEDFNLWNSITPYASKLIGAEGGSKLQTFLAEAGKILQVLVGLPGRTDRVLTMLERGQLNVQVPMMELRMMRLEHSVKGIGTALVFSALLIAGAIVLQTDPTLAKWLMGGAGVALVAMMMRGRGGHGPG